MSVAKRQKPIQEGLYTWPSDRPQLIASKCRDCGEVAFPKQASCPACTGSSTDEIRLSHRGKLWTWTIQRFAPPPPYSGDRGHFAPYGVGYVEMPEGVRVEGRLTTSDPDRLAIGMDMELVVVPFRTDDEGNEVVTFAFRPVD